MGRNTDEFPLLTLYGLKASPIRGDGNCLFNALSDQIYGNQSRHKEIREKVIEHLRENAAWYKQFINVEPGGGQRRNPKRKNVGASSSSFSHKGPTPEEIDAAFEGHLARMARGGTYGDNMEIRAFSKAYDTDVRIFDDNTNDYYVRASDEGFSERVAYIAYHSWEHYSSVRNIEGPNSGLPEVKVKSLSDEQSTTAKANLPRGRAIQDWMLDVVRASLPNFTDEATIRKALVDNNGDVNETVNHLLETQEYSSAPPTPGSLSQSGCSSIERDPDSDEEEIYGPNKRQNRRMSKATQALRKQQQKRIEEQELAAIPTIELTKAEETEQQFAASSLPTPPSQSPHIDPSMYRLKEEKDQSASDADDESRGDDSQSEYTASSRSQSVVPGSTPPRPRIILHTRHSRQNSQSRNTDEPNNAESNAIAVSQPTSNPYAKKKTLITARQRKEMKKAAQKQASKERKRTKNQPRQLASSTSNIKRESPPMEKVLTLGKLSMIQI
ncbi:hypothetical protein BGZ60DRAFT_428603 [Tricladium varicosporioides]|nr:hypothetical protein BGZ60DRAFT_428603 [Hymenoscyphus varicosporioides]